MKEIKLSQGRFCKNKGKYVALVDDEDYEYLSQFRWFVHRCENTCYADKKIVIDGKRTTQSMHNMIMNGKGVDHIDHNGLNNMRSNLRFCSPRENMMNTRKRKNTSSVYKGVNFHKRDKKWQAQIIINGKHIHLGYFNSEVNAAKAYNVRAMELFGEFANLNVINNSN